MSAFLSSKIRVSLWIIIILLNMDVIKNMLLYYCYCYCWVISSSDDHEFDLLFMLLYYRWATATSVDHDLIMDLIILTLWHHCWVIASSDHHEYDYIIIHVITILLSHCFLCWSWIWLNYYSRHYIITESLLSLRIKNLIMLLFMSLHHCWVISTSDDHYNVRQGKSGLWL